MSSGAQFRRFRAFVLATASFVAGASVSAHAQMTSDYFAAPWIFEPTTTLPGQPQAQPQSTGFAGVSLPVNVPQPTAYSNIFGFATQVGNPDAPAWQFTPRIGLNEIATDNVAETQNDRQADLSSQLSAGFLIGADTPHLTGLLDYTGVLQQNLHENHLDGFSNYGYTTAHATVIPGEIYFNLYGSADLVNRAGGGLQNPLLQSGNTTHSYIISGSPYFTTPLGDLGFAAVRYQLGQVWFDQNTGPLTTPIFGASVGPISASTSQQARIDVKMPGTIIPRLATNVTLSGMSEVTGDNALGTFLRSTNELINEYQLSRSISVIGGGGYEWLHDKYFPLVTGQDAVWDIGGRWRPNPDSSLLLVYGHHDLNSDFAGEFQYRITPFTSFYAAYTDSIGTSQQTLLANNNASMLNPAGPVSGVTFAESPVLASLNDAALAQAGDYDTFGVPLGIPLADVNNFAPLDNNIFRTKQFSAILYTNVEESPVSVIVYQTQQTSLTGKLPPKTTTEGVNLSWSPNLTPTLFGLLLGGYNHESVDHSDIWNAAIGVRYTLSETLSVALRYDYIRRNVPLVNSGYAQNAVTLSINKSF